MPVGGGGKGISPPDLKKSKQKKKELYHTLIIAIKSI
jgi:hypothetical protein